LSNQDDTETDQQNESKQNLLGTYAALNATTKCDFIIPVYISVNYKWYYCNENLNNGYCSPTKSRRKNE